MTESKPGRPREYASDADRVRAWRERKKKESGEATADLEAPADPAAAAATLTQVLPLLRQEAEGAIARLSAVADRITGSVELLGDPAALDAHLRRAQVAADKVRADAAAEIEQLRDELDTAIDDRANADAAARAAEAAADDSAVELAEARRDHSEQMQALEVQMHEMEVAHQRETTALAAEHAETLDRWRQQIGTAEAEHLEKLAQQHELVESLRKRVTELGDDVGRVRAEADRATAASTASIERLASDLDEARAAIQAERSRADQTRDELATTRADLAASRTQADATRERVEELRADLAEARARSINSDPETR
ncbi:hypothetical protein [Rhodococcus marinonascens]|uniref:hypothetical protein n=1 Tax=Rhodococcus marinonascens TaxID=38311 RepID=UPI000933C54B|nr:hypothetical protein [Rhodococcus marinonascens]